MQKAGIAFYSGTGNTWRVAEMYASAFRQRGLSAELLPIERQGSNATLHQYDWLGLAYPVYAWSWPWQVEVWLRSLPRGTQHAFVFTTAGGAEGSTHRAARRRLESKGYRVRYEAVHHPECHYHFQAAPRHLPDAEVEARYAACRPEVDHAVDQILAGSERHLAPSIAGRLGLTAALWQLYRLGCPTNQWFFRVARSCNGCGLCERLCPAGNIRVNDGRPHYGSRCSACLRCISVCPLSAISFGPMHRRGGRYLAPGFLNYLLTIHSPHS